MQLRTVRLIGLIAACILTTSAAGADDETLQDAVDATDETSVSAVTAPDTSATTDSTTAEPQPFRFSPPAPVKTDFLYGSQAELDLDRGIVTIRRSVGGVPFGPPKVQTLDEFMNEYVAAKLNENAAATRKETLSGTAEDEGMKLELRYDIPNLPPMARSIIGEGESSLHITGYGRLTMSGRSEYTVIDGEELDPTQSKFPTLTMKQELNFQINGTIGSKIYVSIDQDTKRLSDLDNNIRIRYQGEEDEVVQEVELGNTNLSIQGAQFISGGRQNRGLFGVKTRAKWGDMEWTAIASQQKSSTQRKTLRGGAQESEVTIRDIDFVNRRFFWADQFFRERYKNAQAQLRGDPNQTSLVQNTSPAAGDGEVELTQIEVYQYTGVETGTEVQAVAIDDSMYDASTGTLNKTVYTYGDVLQRENSEDLSKGQWQLLGDGSYQYEKIFGEIDFMTSAPATDIAVRITYKDGDGVTRHFPEYSEEAGTDDGIVLKKLVSEVPQPTEPSWNLMWRHVYDLRARGLLKDDLKLDIVEAKNPNKPNTPANSTDTYMTIMKLDVTDDQFQTGKPDQSVDPNLAKIDYGNGLVVFPYLEPFWDAFDDAGLTPTEDDPTGEGVNAMYTSNSSSDLTKATRYALVASYSQTSTQISLGFDILEDSEVVKLNGNILTRDVDYRINYFTGELEFLSSVATQVTQPGADLIIDYESNPLFKPDSETLLGTRGVYKLGDQGQIGTTFLYNSERSSSFRVRVGEEPTQITMLGADASYEFEPYWLTAAVDKLPFVESDERSQIRFEGEVARSLPNLNTRGIAYIDDFEGADNESAVGLKRRGWTLSSPPVNPVTKVGELSREDRGNLAWFNVTGLTYLEKHVWGDEDSQSSSENSVELLHLWYRPDTLIDATSSQRWGGIMRSFGTSGIDISEAQFLDLWVRVDTAAYTLRKYGDAAATPYGTPILHIDLGTISEDVLRVSDETVGMFRVQNLNEEDDIKRGADAPFPTDGGSYVGDATIVENGYNNGKLDYSGESTEDVGLDGCPDEYEDGNGGCLAVAYDGPVTDRNGDNWKGPESSDAYGYPEAYEKINGTEGNRASEGVGLVQSADTEDLNGDLSLNRQNQYVSYAVDLSGNGEYIVREDQTDADFYHYRIPIHDLSLSSVDTIGGPAPSFNQITSMRLWIDGVQDDEIWLAIAGLSFVGNDWTEIKDDNDGFVVTSVNSRQTSNYAPPPEAKIEYDTYGQPQIEHSLSFQITEIEASEIYSAERIFSSGKDLTNYRRMRMYIYGPIHDAYDANTDRLSAFLRLGVDSTAYYEIRVPKLHPGWHKDNYIDVQLDSLTSLKLTQSGEIYSGTDTTSTDGRFRLVGAKRGATVVLPTLSSVRMLQIGVVNESGRAIVTRKANPMEIWFDDLHLDNARNTPGTAFRTSVNIKMADLVTFLATTERQDAAFRTLQTLSTSGSSQQSTESLQLTMQAFRVDKFLPTDWRVQIPVNMSYGSSHSTPRLKSSSDIELVTKEDKDAETSTKRTFSTSTSFSKTSRSRNPFIGMTFDRTGVSLNYAVNKYTTPSSTSRDTTRGLSYGAKFNYDLTPRSPYRAKPFEWLSPMLPEALSSTEVTYVPTTLRFDASTSFRYDSTRQEKLTLGFDSTYVRVTKSFSLSEAYRVQMQPVRSVNSSYDLTFSRDLQNEFEGPIQPSQALGVVANNIFRDNEIGRSQKFSLSYSPSWPWWLGHSYSYSNSYKDTGELLASTGVVATAREFAVNSQQQYNVSSLTFKLREILNRMAGSSMTQGRGSGGRNRGGPAPLGPNNGGEPSSTDSSAAGRRSFGPLTLARGTAGFAGKHLENITGRVSYSDQFNGSQILEDDRPGWMYQAFGYGQRPPLEAPLGIVSNSRITRQFQWDAGTGVGLPFKMRVTGKYSYRWQRGFTLSDTSRSVDVTFPDLTYSWEGLESLPLLDALATSSDLRSAFQQSDTKKFVANEASEGEYMSSHSRSYKLSPLFAWNILWKNKVRSTIRGTWDRSYTDTPVSGSSGTDRDYSTTIGTNWSVTLTASYELETSRGIKLFGDKVWRMNGNINFSLDGSYAYNYSYTRETENVNSDTRTWSVKPSASYRFSKSFTGQAQIEVGQTRNVYSQTTKNVRAVSISGELRFN